MSRAGFRLVGALGQSNWWGPHQGSRARHVVSWVWRKTNSLLSRAWRLNCGHACPFGRVDEAVSGGKPLQERVCRRPAAVSSISAPQISPTHPWQRSYTRPGVSFRDNHGWNTVMRRLNDPTVGPTGRTDRSARPLGPTVVSCERSADSRADRLDRVNAAYLCSRRAPSGDIWSTSTSPERSCQTCR